MGIHRAYDQFVSDDDTLDRVAAVQLCFLESNNYSIVSRCATRMAQRAVEVVSLDRLTYRLRSDEKYQVLSDAKARRHSSILRKSARQDLPKEKRFLRDWDWLQTGFLRTVNSFTWRVPSRKNAFLPARMAGDHIVKSAIIAIEAPHHDVKEAWLTLTGLPRDFLRFFPKSNLIYACLLGHEFDHVFQRTWSKFVPKEGPLRFAMEADADSVSIGALFKLARKELAHRLSEINEFAEAYKYARAVNAFLSAEPHYWIAVPNVSYDEAVASMQELRLRVVAHIHGIGIPDSSRAIQQLIATWQANPEAEGYWPEMLEKAFGGPFTWLDMSLDQSFPALREVIKSRKIDDPLTLRKANLVVDALTYFHDGIQAKPDLHLLPDLPPEADHRPELFLPGSYAPQARQNIYAAPNMA